MECVFGILKNRWKILYYGILFRAISVVVVVKVFVVWFILHNIMLTEMELKESNVMVNR